MLEVLAPGPRDLGPRGFDRIAADGLGQYAEGASAGMSIAAPIAKQIAGSLTTKLTGLLGGGKAAAAEAAKAKAAAQLQIQQRNAANYGMGLAEFQKYHAEAKAAGMRTVAYLESKGIFPKPLAALPMTSGGSLFTPTNLVLGAAALGLGIFFFWRRKR